MFGMFHVDAATLNRLPDGSDVGYGKWERGKSCASFGFPNFLGKLNVGDLGYQNMYGN